MTIPRPPPGWPCLTHTTPLLPPDPITSGFTIPPRLERPCGSFARRNDEFYAHYQAGTPDVHDHACFCHPRRFVVAGALRPPRQPMRSSCAR